MFSGSIVALITPFDSEGYVDFPALEGLIERQIDAGTQGLVLCGSTGEGSSLSRDEKEEIFNMAAKVAKGRILLIGATGTNQTRESIALTEEAKEAGLDGCIAIVPYYSKPTEEGCFRHFASIAEVGLPMIAYHHPGRTGLRLSEESLERICAIEGVVGLKEASGDLNLAQALVRRVKCPLFSGDDSLALPHLAVGFSGSISIIGNVAPSQWKGFIEKALLGDFLGAREEYEKLYSLVQALVLETNPQCVKYAVSLLGLCSSMVRLPLIEPSEKVQAILHDRLHPFSLMSRL